ncbi:MULTISPECIES: glycoside hydrolase family 97 protein [Sphingomonas]|uniref:Glycoside hydrolase family 97 protein n=1 Tax=Sphingomonas kyungheensis TaxID=1069987 RepID=A0ABU8H225_9SPHN|nr:glycoside hydrolase family 97 protein [Sphingomonas sp. RIT328]EZP56770.1 Glycoside hydrolase 97 family protein [Sphingomonas sp. RIT328]
MRALWLAATLIAAPAAAQTVASPDGRLVVTLGTNADDQPTYALAVAGRPVITPSPLGLEFEQYAKLANGLRTTGVAASQGEDRYTLRAGKVAAVAERYNQIIVHLAEPGGTHRRLDLILRAYDGGIALRYGVPQQPGLTTLRIANELTQFAFAGDYACTGLNLGSFGTSHEGEYDPVRAAAIRPHNLYELPLVCDTGNAGPSIAIAEAAVEHWPVMYLTGTETGALGVAAKLTRRPDDPAIAVRLDVGAGIVSPWRVVMVADTAGKLIEHTLLTSLNPPPQGDFAWVRPGKTAWDWWSGPLLAGVTPAGSNAATERAFIDFAASLKLPYMMIDDGWYANSGTGPLVLPGADPTRPIPAIDLPGLVRYARARDVGLILWINWQLLDRDMEGVLAAVEKFGAKGIKVDFMNRDDQAMVDFYHRLAAATARHHLLLDLHGATHPWGMTRTWPNFITQEGVLGAEYNKWTKRITARHNITLAYTRMLAGPLDYTPGGYRNATPASFRIAVNGPQTQTTRAAELAKYVVFESPLQSVADTPDAYRGQPGLDFLAEVPASWDETRFVQGTLGELIVLARRKGDRWYLGAMTDAGQTIAVPLTFLGKGRYRVRTWQDGATAADLATGGGTVDATSTLPLALHASGGGVAILTPVR